MLGKNRTVEAGWILQDLDDPHPGQQVQGHHTEEKAVLSDGRGAGGPVPG